MTAFAQGFLSAEMVDIPAAVRSLHEEESRLVRAVNGRCMSLSYLLQIDATNSQQLVSASLFARIVASSQATIILLEHGLVSQARAILRTALEALFALAAVHADAKVAETIANSFDANKRSLADKLLRQTNADLKSLVFAEVSEEKLREFLADKTPEANAAQLAASGGMTDWYLSVYPLLSFAVHTSAADLTNHLIRNSNGVIVAIKNEPEVEEQHAIWLCTSEILLKARRAVIGIFQLNESEDTDLYSTLKELATDA
jgi:hypothetical protein